MEQDAKVKRATFISRSVEIRETFKFASPVEVLHAMKVYCSSFYGCMLWDLAGEGATQVFNSWNTGIRLTWSVPRATRTYLVQQVLSAGLTSAKVDILARYRNFFHGLRQSPCYEVAVMADLSVSLFPSFFVLHAGMVKSRLFSPCRDKSGSSKCRHQTWAFR